MSSGGAKKPWQDWRAETLPALTSFKQSQVRHADLHLPEEHPLGLHHQISTHTSTHTYTHVYTPTLTPTPTPTVEIEGCLVGSRLQWRAQAKGHDHLQCHSTEQCSSQGHHRASFFPGCVPSAADLERWVDTSLPLPSHPPLPPFFTVSGLVLLSQPSTQWAGQRIR